MVARRSVADTKQFWFEDELIVYLTQINENIYALPKIEVERSLKYCELIEECKSYNELQRLFENYQTDPNKPKLIPKIRNLYEELEDLEEMWIQADMSENRHYGQLTNEELINYWLEKKFDLWDRESPSIYLDESGTLMLVRDFQVWTDAWIPGELAHKVGVKDTNFGIDYLNAEFIYQNLELFIKEFKHHGFDLIFDAEQFVRLLTYT
jgi:hypothetical protein